MQFLPDWYKTQEMCDKAVGTWPFVFDSVLDTTWKVSKYGVISGPYFSTP